MAGPDTYARRYWHRAEVERLKERLRDHSDGKIAWNTEMENLLGCRDDESLDDTIRRAARERDRLRKALEEIANDPLGFYEHEQSHAAKIRRIARAALEGR